MPTVHNGGLVVGVELGGTKIVVASSVAGHTVETIRSIATADPDSTLSEVRAAIAEVADSRDIGAIGIGSFGPVDLRVTSPRHGEILASPKQDWVGTNVIRGLTKGLDCDVRLDTDVNVALIAETSLGAARSHNNVAYLTVGTGVGGGLFVEGRVLHGSGHPEIGHIRVPRRPGESHNSVCPFHDDCLEGMISGTAIQQRTGRRAEDLGEQTDEIMGLVAWYLASGIANLCAVVPVDIVVIGGGVSRLPGLHGAVASNLEEASGTYPPIPFADGGPAIVAPELGDRSGIIGAILLAEGPIRGSEAS